MPRTSAGRCLDGKRSGERKGTGYFFSVRVPRNAWFVGVLRIQPLLGSGKISSGNKYSSPAVPKLTRISFRPRFSTVLTKVPSRGKSAPDFCDRINFLVFNRSPGLMAASTVFLINSATMFVPPSQSIRPVRPASKQRRCQMRSNDTQTVTTVFTGRRSKRKIPIKTGHFRPFHHFASPVSVPFNETLTVSKISHAADRTGNNAQFVEAMR